MKRLIVMGGNIPARKHSFNVGKKLRVNGHHIFEVTVNRALLDHPNLTVTLDDLGLDLSDFLVNQHRNLFTAVEDRLTRFNYAVRAKRVGRPRPAKLWRRPLVRLEQRPVSPLRLERCCVDPLVYRLKRGPQKSGPARQGEFERLPRIHS